MQEKSGLTTGGIGTGSHPQSDDPPKIPTPISGPLDFALHKPAMPALRFINPNGHPGAAISVRHEPHSGQGSLQFVVYEEGKAHRWFEPFRVNGDEHPPEHPNSRFNRHARFQYGFYTPGVSGPEQASLEMHREPGQVPFQITSEKTDQPLMVLNQLGASETGFPILLIRNSDGPVFIVRRNGALYVKGMLHAAGPIVLEAPPTTPNQVVSKGYVDEKIAKLTEEIARLRDLLSELGSGKNGNSVDESDSV